MFLPRSFVIGAWISGLVATLIVARSLRFRRR
jgi:hypothetical protein